MRGFARTEEGVQPLGLVVVFDGDTSCVEEDENDDDPIEGRTLHYRPNTHPVDAKTVNS